MMTRYVYVDIRKGVPYLKIRFTYRAPVQDTDFGSARPWRASLCKAMSACSFENQTALGFGRLGRSGSMKKPANPQTTVMMALMIKSHLSPK